MKNIPLYRAWRFTHSRYQQDQYSTAMGQVDAISQGICLNHSGGVQMIGNDASIRQAILLLLSTRPSERVMRPDYGCNLHKLVFSPNDETTAGLAIHYVKQAINRWEPRIEILMVDATRNELAPERLDIHLEYQMRNGSRREHLTFPFSLIE